MTVQEQLEQINAAIKAIENGAQEYQIGSKRLRRPDLYILYQERRLLQRQLYEESGSSISVAVFDRR
ncbi:MAG: peptidylprolyl isomerase [Peptococcaceae bacterium]|jgi:conjugal transfer/entry exclusion protein|nr:peptidylprolyl isomerase [Peptococcaceae bacterium]MDH7525279.1 peptidylprolyl isomerase [Peptococcaceae bacterium]